MAELEATYVFRDGKVYAVHAGSVIASGDDDKVDEVESDATAYLDSLKKDKADKKKKEATHIITPNGVKGKIITRTAGVWGEEVTVRFENGQVTSFGTHAVTDWVTENQKTAAGPVNGLEQRLAATYNHDRGSLVERYHELNKIAGEAGDTIRAGSSDADAQKLHEISVCASAEAQRVADSIEYIDQNNIEAYQPPTPIAVEQADLGNAGQSWLDATLEDMVRETDEQDMEKVLNDDPILLAADLDDEVLAEQGIAREYAMSHVLAKTAGYQGDDVDEFRTQFVARFEQARRRELKAREQNTRREAAAEESNVTDAPDEALFG